MSPALIDIRFTSPLQLSGNRDLLMDSCPLQALMTTRRSDLQLVLHLPPRTEIWQSRQDRSYLSLRSPAERFLTPTPAHSSAQPRQHANVRAYAGEQCLPAAVRHEACPAIPGSRVPRAARSWLRASSSPVSRQRRSSQNSCIKLSTRASSDVPSDATSACCALTSVSEKCLLCRSKAGNDT